MSRVSASGIPLTADDGIGPIRLLEVQAVALADGNPAEAARLLFSAAVVVLCEGYAPPVALHVAEITAAELPVGVRNMLTEKGLL